MLTSFIFINLKSKKSTSILLVGATKASKRLGATQLFISNCSFLFIIVAAAAVAAAAISVIAYFVAQEIFFKFIRHV